MIQVLAGLLSWASIAATPFPTEVDPGGCRLERIAGVAGENHVMYRGVSPDGRLLAIGWDRKVDGVTQRGAYLLDLRSGRRTDLPGLNNAASFSPDGRRLVAAVYTPDRNLLTEIVELDRATGQVRSLAPSPAMDWLPSYAPDGRSVVFNSMRSGASDLYRVRLSDGRVEQLTDDPRYEAHGDVSPDGRRVLFHRQIEDHDYDLALLDLRTREVRMLRSSPREEAYPDWSPDGRRFSYSSDTGQTAGLGDLYLADADGGRPMRLTAHPAKDAYSAWAPDGRAIYFMSFRDEGAAVYRIRLRNGDCVRAPD